MRKRRCVEKPAATRRTRSTACRSDSIEAESKGDAESRVLSVENGEVTNETPAVIPSKDEEMENERRDLEELMRVLEMVRKTEISQEVLRVKKRSDFKLPMKAFMTWERLERPRMFIRFPDTSRKEMSTLLGLMWRKMGTGEKKVFYLMTDRDNDKKGNADEDYSKREKSDYSSMADGEKAEQLSGRSNDSSDKETKSDSHGSKRLLKKEVDESAGSKKTSAQKSKETKKSNVQDKEVTSEGLPKSPSTSAGHHQEKESSKKSTKRVQKHTEKDSSNGQCHSNSSGGRSNNAADSSNSTQSSGKHANVKGSSGKKVKSGVNKISDIHSAGRIELPSSVCSFKSIKSEKVQNVPSFEYSTNDQPLNYTSGKNIQPSKSAVQISTASQSFINVRSDHSDISVNSVHQVDSGVYSCNSDQSVSDVSVRNSHSTGAASTDASSNSNNVSMPVNLTNNIGAQFCGSFSFYGNKNIPYIPVNHSFEKTPTIMNTILFPGSRLIPESLSVNHPNISTPGFSQVYNLKQPETATTRPNSEIPLSKSTTTEEKSCASQESKTNRNSPDTKQKSEVTGSNQKTDFVEEDFDYGDDEDDFPHLVIDDSRENQTPESNPENPSNGEVGEDVKDAASDSTDAVLGKPTSSAGQDEMDKESNQSSQSQPTSASETLQTVTYVFRQNQENLYSTTRIPTITQLPRAPVQHVKDLHKPIAKMTIMPTTTTTTTTKAKAFDDIKLANISSLAPEGESDFADVSTMCENILNQNCLVTPLGKSPDETSTEISLVEKLNQSYMQYRSSKFTPAPLLNKKGYFIPRKKPYITHSKPSYSSQVKSSTAPVYTSSGMHGWNHSMSMQKSYFIRPVGNNPYVLYQSRQQPQTLLAAQEAESSSCAAGKEDEKGGAKLKDLPSILLQESKLAKPRIIGPLSASALESVLSFSPTPSRLDKSGNAIPVSKFVPGTREMYRDTGMGNINKNGNIKRPMNAFMVWARSYRGHLTMLYPNESNKLVSQRLGDMWKKMSLEDKQPYYREADRIKRQHREDYPDWKYKPNTPKSRPEKMGTHDVLWARFIGATESLDEPSSSKKLKFGSSKNGPSLSKLGVPFSDAKNKNNPDIKKRSYPLPLPDKVKKFEKTAKPDENAADRAVDCSTKFQFGQKSSNNPGLSVSIAQSGDAKITFPNTNTVTMSQDVKPYGQPPVLTTSTGGLSALGNPMMKYYTPASCEMLSVPKISTIRPCLIKTSTWNPAKPPCISQAPFVSFNTSTISLDKSSSTASSIRTTVVGNESGVKSLHYPSFGQNLLNNIPFNFHIPSQPPQFVTQYMPLDFPSKATINTTEASKFSSFYTAKPTTTLSTKQLTRLLPGEVTKVLPEPSITAKIDKPKENVSSAASLPSSSSTPALGDAASYVSSVLKSPRLVYTPVSAEHVATPVQPSFSSFVRVPSTTSTTHMITMPVISAETYKQLLEKGNAGGSYLTNTLSLLPLQSSWIKPATTTGFTSVTTSGEKIKNERPS